MPDYDIDLTLDSLMIPAISETFPFGTKVIPTAENKGGLSTFDVNSNMMLPFTRMRPRVCSADSVTSRVEYDAKIVFSAPQGTTPASGYTLTLGTGDYVGCTVTFTNLLAHACTVRQSDGTTTLFSVPAGKTMSAMWGGSSWLWTTAGSVTAGDPTPVSSAAVHAAIDALDNWHEAWSGNLTIPNTDGIDQILTVPAIKNSRQVAVLINDTIARGPSRIVLDNVSGAGDSFQTYISNVTSYYLTIAFQVVFGSGEIKATGYSAGWSLKPKLVKVLYR